MGNKDFSEPTEEGLRDCSIPVRNSYLAVCSPIWGQLEKIPLRKLWYHTLMHTLGPH